MTVLEVGKTASSSGVKARQPSVQSSAGRVVVRGVSGGSFVFPVWASQSRTKQNTVAPSTGLIESNVLKQLLKISALRDGWQGPQSRAPQAPIIADLVSLRSHIRSDAMLSVGGDGSIIVEWLEGHHEYLVSIEHDDLIVYVVEDSNGALIAEREFAYSRDVLQVLLQASVGE